MSRIKGLRSVFFFLGFIICVEVVFVLRLSHNFDLIDGILWLIICAYSGAGAVLFIKD